ncbi:hypothetical protein C8R42DRAFT_391987 [Lentinula raphanica]|nr:hypothetical protein C8R42DRAFT_391987 [Lentinula raphanica]
MMHATRSVFSCLLLGLIAAVCAAPAPLRRDSYVKASVTYVHNPAAGDVPLDEDRLLGWSQSVIDQQDLRETVFGFSEDVKILAVDIPQYQQETIHFTVSGGACFLTEACDVVLSGSSSEDTLPVIVSKNGQQLYSSAVNYEGYDASRFIS